MRRALDAEDRDAGDLWEPTQAQLLLSHIVGAMSAFMAYFAWNNISSGWTACGQMEEREGGLGILPFHQQASGIQSSKDDGRKHC